MYVHDLCLCVLLLSAVFSRLNLFGPTSAVGGQHCGVVVPVLGTLLRRTGGCEVERGPYDVSVGDVDGERKKNSRKMGGCRYVVCWGMGGAGIETEEHRVFAIETRKICTCNFFGVVYRYARSQIHFSFSLLEAECLVWFLFGPGREE